MKEYHKSAMINYQLNYIESITIRIQFRGGRKIVREEAIRERVGEEDLRGKGKGTFQDGTARGKNKARQVFGETVS